MIFLDVLANILQEEFLDIAFLFRIRCLNLRTASYVYVESGLADFKYQRSFRAYAVEKFVRLSGL